MKLMRIKSRAVKKKYGFSKYFLYKMEKEGKLLPVERTKLGERVYEEEDIKKFIESLPSY